MSASPVGYLHWIMEPFYPVTFASLALICIGLEVWKRQTQTKSITSTKGFVSFRNNYLFVYSLMMGALPRMHVVKDDTLRLSCSSSFFNSSFARLFQSPSGISVQLGIGFKDLTCTRCTNTMGSKSVTLADCSSPDLDRP